MKHHHRDLFSASWWGNHPRAAHGRWHYYRRHHPHYWWRWASWRAVRGWFLWAPWAQATPVYYDYGYGGTVYYEDNTVYVDGQPAATSQEYAEQATGIAGSIPADVDEDKVEWMPLGVFALTHEEKGEPDMFLQLTVSKEGIIAGTYHNTVSGSSLPVEGMVDQQSQRAAWTIGGNKDTVLETGVYNLTLDETPVLVHFGTERTQTWLMVRLAEQESEQSQE